MAIGRRNNIFKQLINNKKMPFKERLGASPKITL